jgi:hypothetical protein
VNRWISGLLILVLAAGLLLGFSFLERGSLAHHVFGTVAPHGDGSFGWHGWTGKHGMPGEGMKNSHFHGHAAEDWNHGRRGGMGSVAAWIPTLIGIISLVVLADAFLRRELDQTQEHVTTAPWKSLWMGFLTVLITAAVSFLLGISIVGIPVVLVLMVGLMIAIGIGFATLAVHAGTLVSDRLNWLTDACWKTLILGAVLLAHLAWVPAVGWLVLTGIFLTGLGGVMMHWVPRLRERWRTWREKRRNR